VIGVSPDLQEKNDRFRESLTLPYALVGDPRGLLARAYDTRWPIGNRVRRTTYVIDPDRKIKEAYRSELRPRAHVERACAVVAPTAGGEAP
jgi:thioredoxin-dependent peroxiredoxin